MAFGYTVMPMNNEDSSSAAAVEALTKYATENKLPLQFIVEDPETNKTHWEKRMLYGIINSAEADADLLVYDASALARSTLQVIEVLEFLSSRDITLHLVKYNECFLPTKIYDTGAFLSLMRCIEGEFVTRRTTDAVERRRAAGLPLGRPKGRKNKSRKLDQYRHEIKKYLALDLNKASIAKLVGCHAQTLYNYLEDTGVLAEVEKEREKLLREAEKQGHNLKKATS